MTTAPAFLRGNTWPETHAAAPASLCFSKEWGQELSFGREPGDLALEVGDSSSSQSSWDVSEEGAGGTDRSRPSVCSPPSPLVLGGGPGRLVWGIDCQRNKSKARVKCNNHVRGEKLQKYTTGSLNSYLVDKLLIETHYFSVPDSQKCLSCLEDHNKTGCLLCLPLILMGKDRALCNKV